MKVTLVSNGDDWEGLYVDGKLKTEGHSVTPHDLAAALDLEWERVTVSSNWLGYEVGSLPQELSKIPKKAICK